MHIIRVIKTSYTYSFTNFKTTPALILFKFLRETTFFTNEVLMTDMCNQN
jgi:hypothetical protein